jgi:hypothetical protein
MSDATWTPPRRFFGQVAAADLNAGWTENIKYIAENLPHHITLWHNTSLVTAGNALAGVSAPSQYYYWAWLQNVSADADSFTQSFVCASGTYDVYILCRKTANSGKVDWTLDGVSIDTAMDFYNAATLNNQILTIADVSISTPGRHKLQATVNGKNASSGGYDVQITKIHAVRSDQTYAEKVLATSPIGFWRLNETSGTNAADSSGNGYDGTYVSATINNDTGPDGQPCPTFDSLNDEVNLDSPGGVGAAFDGTTGTAMVWLKVSAAGVWTDGLNRKMLGIRVDGSNYIEMLKTSANNTLRWRYRAGGTNETVSKGSVTSTGWICTAITWDSGADKVRMFFNGVQEGADQSGLGTWAGVPGNISIGSQTGTSFYWDGSLALAAIWDTVLSDATILDLATV